MALTDNLTAFYEFESGALTTDATANGLTLTNNNTVTSVSGKVGNAGSFVAASSQYLSHADNSLYQPGPDLTIQAWVNYTSIPTSNGIVSKDNESTQRSYNLVASLATSHPQFFVFDSVSGFSSVDWGAAISFSTWYHYIAIYDSSNKKPTIIINDGTPVQGSALSNGIITTATAAFMIGNDAAGTTRYIDGLIDQVGIWQRVLSASEITQLYNSGNGLSYAAMAPSGIFLPRRRNDQAVKRASLY